MGELSTEPEITKMLHIANSNELLLKTLIDRQEKLFKKVKMIEQTVEEAALTIHALSFDLREIRRHITRQEEKIASIKRILDGRGSGNNCGRH